MSDRGETTDLTTLPALDPIEPTEPPYPVEADEFAPRTEQMATEWAPARPPQLIPEGPPTSAPPWWWTRGAARAGDPPRWSSNRIALVLAAAVVGVLIAASIAAPILRSRGETQPPRRGVQSPSLRPPRRASPNDPAALALADLVVRGDDVDADASVEPIPGGDDPVNQPTLDLCNGTFASESLRRARLQVVVVDPVGTTGLSTEAVVYEDSISAAQALAEVRDVASSCPGTPVPSPVGEPTVITAFNPGPDDAWPTTTGVERAAFDLTTTDASGSTHHSIAVYLRRGRFLEGVYFPQPDGPQTAIAGETDIGAIVAIFEHRLEQLPNGLANGLTA